MNKKKEKRKIERWDWEKLRGERDQESETNLTATTRDPSHCPDSDRPHQCHHVRPILLPITRSALSNFVAPVFTIHNSHFTLKYLIYPSKPNIMIVNLKICACGVCVFTNEWWWWLWIEYMNLWLCLWLPVLKSFFFFFWLFPGVWVCE